MLMPMIMVPRAWRQAARCESHVMSYDVTSHHLPCHAHSPRSLPLSCVLSLFVLHICRYDSVHDDDERVRRGLLRLLGQPRMHYWGLIDQLLFMEQAL